MALVVTLCKRGDWVAFPGEFVMDGGVLAVRATARTELAKVVRDFAGSRIERQIVAQAVEIAWQVAASRDEGGAGLMIEKERALSGVMAPLTEGAQA
jgi:hypothetical protein